MPADTGLPDIDGVALCRRLHVMLPVESGSAVLAARTQEFEVVVALDSDPDGYLAKPFRFTELLTRLRAHLCVAQQSRLGNSCEPQKSSRVDDRITRPFEEARTGRNAILNIRCESAGLGSITVTICVIASEGGVLQ